MTHTHTFPKLQSTFSVGEQIEHQTSEYLKIDSQVNQVVYSFHVDNIDVALLVHAICAYNLLAKIPETHHIFRNDIRISLVTPPCFASISRALCGRQARRFVGKSRILRFVN